MRLKFIGHLNLRLILGKLLAVFLGLLFLLLTLLDKTLLLKSIARSKRHVTIILLASCNYLLTI